jgi:hypothetical protein
MLGHLLQWTRPCLNNYSYIVIYFLILWFQENERALLDCALDRYDHFVAWTMYYMMPSYPSNFVLGFEVDTFSRQTVYST